MTPNEQSAPQLRAGGKTRCTHYTVAYHFVWIPTYRLRIFDDKRPAACKTARARCCTTHGFKPLAVETDVDCVHVFVSAAPRRAPATIVGLLKGGTSRDLRKEFPELKRLCGRSQRWTQAYYAGTAGTMSAQIIRRYITQCQGR